MTAEESVPGHRVRGPHVVCVGAVAWFVPISASGMPVAEAVEINSFSDSTEPSAVS